MQTEATDKMEVPDSGLSPPSASKETEDGGDDIAYSTYRGEEDLAELSVLVDSELSEPYNIFTYRYFVNQWPELTFLARREGRLIGVIVCKAETFEKNKAMRGYIAMLVVDQTQRKGGRDRKRGMEEGMEGEGSEIQVWRIIYFVFQH